MSSEQTRPRWRTGQYWRNMARALGCMLLVGVGILVIALVILLVQAAERPLHPSRRALTESPADVGITDYQDVTFTASDGVTLSGWYMPPQNGAAINFAPALRMTDEASTQPNDSRKPGKRVTWEL